MSRYYSFITKPTKVSRISTEMVPMKCPRMIRTLPSVTCTMQLLKAIILLTLCTFKWWHLIKPRTGNSTHLIWRKSGPTKSSLWYLSENWFWIGTPGIILRKLSKLLLVLLIWFLELNHLRIKCFRYKTPNNTIIDSFQP